MNHIEEFNQLFDLSPEEQIDHDAQMLAFQFLSRIDEAMEKQNISKKSLARKVGTSASFITQLFRGDRKPNWIMLAKMQQELDLRFNVKLTSEIEVLLDDRITDYHRKLSKSQFRNKKYQDSISSESHLSVLTNVDYALAG